MEKQTNWISHRQPPTSENAKKSTEFDSFLGEKRYSETTENGAAYTSFMAIALGVRGEKCKDAVCFFGNRAVLDVLNNSEERKAELKRMDILSGETVPDFSGDAPESCVSLTEPFPTRSVPDFSALAPIQSVQNISAAGMEYGSS